MLPTTASFFGIAVIRKLFVFQSCFVCRGVSHGKLTFDAQCTGVVGVACAASHKLHSRIPSCAGSLSRAGMELAYQFFAQEGLVDGSLESVDEWLHEYIHE